MSQMSTKIHNLKCFSWDKEAKLLTTFFSDLYKDGDHNPFCSRIAGFAILSDTTGKVEEFKISNVIKDREGDVQYWELDNKTLGIKVVVWND